MRTGDAFCPICIYFLGNVRDGELPRVCPNCEYPIGVDVDSKEAKEWAERLKPTNHNGN